LKLALVSIPKGQLEVSDWSIVFDGATEGGGILTINMKGREPESFVVDD
jgi:hypothetical protein